MNKYILYLAIVAALLAANPLYTQDFAPVGTAVAQFLEIGTGARGTSMGEAFTAIPSNPDAGSVFWNPAGLADIRKRNLYTSYTKWPADISIGSIAFALNSGNTGTFAVSAVYLMTDDMEITTLQQPEGTGEMFSISNYALGLSYARRLTDRFSFGISAKLVHEQYLSYGYSTWAMDIGTLYSTGFHGLKIGMSILHFAPEVQFNGKYIDYSDPLSIDADKPKTFETYSLPINFRFGISLDLLRNGYHSLVLAADMVHPNNNLEQYNTGMEYCFDNRFFLRAGYQLDDNEGGVAVGAGTMLAVPGNRTLALDYAFADKGILTSAHRVSFSFFF
ncbi:PorV/PorQ family protein [bacterium]|nr:PorV/PorQ family protein [bacterium]